MNTRRAYGGRRCALAAAALMVTLVGCSGSDAPGAAEPATAPPTTAAPAGTTFSVGDGPEGIVYDAKTDTVAVAVRNPARLLLLDPRSLAVRRTVPLPGTVRHLQLAGPGGPVLVPDESSNRLLEVSLPDGNVRATSVGKQPHDAAGVDGGEIVVGNEFGHSISFLRDGQVVETVPGPKQPGGIIGDGSVVGVVDVGDFTLSTYSVSSRQRIAQVPAGKGPTHGVLLDGDRFAVADTRGNALLVYSVSPLKQVGTGELVGAPYGMAVDGDTVWVTLTTYNQVVGLDVSSDTPRVIARFDTVRQPNTVAVAPGSHTLWVTGTDDGTVERINR